MYLKISSLLQVSLQLLFSLPRLATPMDTLLKPATLLTLLYPTDPAFLDASVHPLPLSSHLFPIPKSASVLVFFLEEAVSLLLKKCVSRFAK